MTGWIIFGAYALGYLCFWRTVVWHLINDLSLGGEVWGEDLAFALLIGSFFTLMWPLIGVGLTAQAIYRAKSESIVMMLMPRREKKRRELEQRERRIFELERELGLR